METEYNFINFAPEEEKLKTRENEIDRLYKRSLKSLSTYRKELHQIYPEIKLYDPEAHYEEDLERDKNMITTYDILNLFLSEKKDFETFKQPGVNSPRTEKLALNVTWGLMYGLRAPDKYTPEFHRKYQSYKTQLEYRRTLEENLLKVKNSNDLIVSLHKIFAMMHTITVPLMPIRDLYLAREIEVQRFFDFLDSKLI